MAHPTALDPTVLAGFSQTRQRVDAALAQAPAPTFSAPAPARSDNGDAGRLLAPPDWESYIGQEAVKSELRIRIHSALTRNAPLEHTLLTGPGGAGKTALVDLVAAELDRPLIKLTKPVRSDALIDLLWNAPPGALLFIDEIHVWGARTANGGQHTIMQITEEGTIDTAMGTKVAVPVTVIAATTNPERLFPPLLSRFMVQCDFDDYTDDELTVMVASMSGRAGVPLDHRTCAALGQAAAGSPRAARALVLAARDLHMGCLPIDAATVLAMTGTDPDGLTKPHRRYLERLSAAPHGRAGLTTMSTLTGLPSGQLVAVEALLSRRGYVEMGPSGRQITADGRRRIAS